MQTNDNNVNNSTDRKSCRDRSALKRGMQPFTGTGKYVPSGVVAVTDSSGGGMQHGSSARDTSRYGVAVIDSSGWALQLRVFLITGSYEVAVTGSRGWGMQIDARASILEAAAEIDPSFATARGMQPAFIIPPRP